MYSIPYRIYVLFYYIRNFSYYETSLKQFLIRWKKAQVWTNRLTAAPFSHDLIIRPVPMNNIWFLTVSHLPVSIILCIEWNKSVSAYTVDQERNRATEPLFKYSVSLLAIFFICWIYFTQGKLTPWPTAAHPLLRVENPAELRWHHKTASTFNHWKPEKIRVSLGHKHMGHADIPFS